MADQTQLTVALTPEQGKFVSDQLAAGRYQSASEVVSEGLRLLQQQDQAPDADLDAVRAKIAVGLEQLDRGEVYDKEQVFQELRERSRSSRGKGGRVGAYSRPRIVTGTQSVLELGEDRNGDAVSIRTGRVPVSIPRPRGRPRKRKDEGSAEKKRSV